MFTTTTTQKCSASVAAVSTNVSEVSMSSLASSEDHLAHAALGRPGGGGGGKRKKKTIAASNFASTVVKVETVSAAAPVEIAM